MAEINRENVEAFGDVARAICHIPESEPLILFTIAGQRTEGCGRDCEGCSRYLECFPETNPEEQAIWERLLNQLLQKEVKDESQANIARV